jgi:long-chain acyl-CoA synthetase
MSGPSVRNVADLLTRTVARHSDRPALVTDTTTTTWAEVDAAVSRFASGLQRRGVGVGDPVALVLPTSEEFVVAYLGTLRAGGVAVPLNTEYTAGELARLVGRTGAVAVVAGAPGLVAVRQAVAGIADALTDDPGPEVRPVPWVVVTGDAMQDEVAYADVAADDGLPVPHERGGEDVAVMLFTSGSSADPRAALLSHRALVSNLDQLMAIEPAPVTSDDVMLAVLPLFHVYGLNTVLGQAIVSGASMVLAPRFDAEGTLRTIVEHGVTIVPAAPPMLVAWSEREDVAESLARVRYLASGAAPLPVAVIEHLTETTGVPIHQGYGLTEAAPVVSTTLMSPTLKPGSVGRPLSGTEVMLVDESGEPVDEGDPGEVVVRGPNLFSGYWPGDVEGPDPDGWWRTGDVAYVDADGDLFLVDRIKDLVIVNGFNVYPREVEEVLLEHPAIAQAAVLPVPDRRTGEAVKAVVAPEPGATVTEQEVHDFCRTRLARFKRPTYVDVVESLPRTATGKIAKGRLRDLAVREADKRRAGLT